MEVEEHEHSAQLRKRWVGPHDALRDSWRITASIVEEGDEAESPKGADAMQETSLELLRACRRIEELEGELGDSEESCAELKQQLAREVAEGALRREQEQQLQVSLDQLQNEVRSRRGWKGLGQGGGEA